MPRSSWLEGGEAALVPIALTLAIAAAGCHAACDPSIEANTPEVLSTGITVDGAYQSGAWTGPHLAFPGGKRWNLEHHLGAAPRHVAVYLAFNSDTRELAPCAGNTCVFCVDDQYIWLRNDTCADFWVRVEADGADPAVVTPPCDASPSNGAGPDAAIGATSDALGVDAATADGTSSADPNVDPDASAAVPP